jgi:hypothetical protein
VTPLEKVLAAAVVIFLAVYVLVEYDAWRWRRRNAKIANSIPAPYRSMLEAGKERRRRRRSLW